MLAAKFFDDQYFNNAYYAKVGGVPTNEMNTLEVEFLFMSNFTLYGLFYVCFCVRKYKVCVTREGRQMNMQ